MNYLYWKKDIRKKKELGGNLLKVGERFKENIEKYFRLKLYIIKLYIYYEYILKVFIV